MKIFKTCSSCRTPWFSRDEFLEDSNIYLVGYQANFGDLKLGIFLFNHVTCQSTIGIPAGIFKDLHDGPVFSECLTESEQCPGHCRYSEILHPCRAKCEGAYVREILQILRNWPKEVHFPDKIAVLNKEKDKNPCSLRPLPENPAKILLRASRLPSTSNLPNMNCC